MDTDTGRPTRYFALVAGIVYTLVGAAGFIPALVTPAAMPDSMMMGAGYGYLMGLFPVNVLHNIVHLILGIWGILAYRSFDASRIFSRTLAIVYIVLAIMGLIPALNMNTTFGLVPIFGLDVGLHLVTALIAAYFGWMARSDTPGGRVEGRSGVYESRNR